MKTLMSVDADAIKNVVFALTRIADELVLLNTKLEKALQEDDLVRPRMIEQRLDDGFYPGAPERTT